MKIFTYLIGMSLFLTLNISKIEAQNLKEGVFKYGEEPYKETKVIRTKRFQYEEHATGIKVKYKIDWVSDFEYHLTFKQVSDPSGDCLLNRVIKVKILDTHGSNSHILTEFEGNFTTLTLNKIDDIQKMPRMRSSARANNKKRDELSMK